MDEKTVVFFIQKVVFAPLPRKKNCCFLL